jgi:uncharacterized membrane protein
LTVIRSRSVSVFTFAIVMIGLGVFGLASPDAAPMWNPIWAKGALHGALIEFGAGVSLATGTMLLIPRFELLGARILCAALLLWLLVFRLPTLLYASIFAACWSLFPFLVFVVAAWAIWIRVASDWDRQRFHFPNSKRELRLAHVLYGVSLIFFGTAHFIDLSDTLALIPHWLPCHIFWAYFTGCTFCGAGVAIIVGFRARVAAALASLQIMLFLLVVWIPILATGSRNLFQWSETVLNAVLFVCAWVITDLWVAPREISLK